MHKIFSKRGAEAQLTLALIVLALVALGVLGFWPVIIRFFLYSSVLNGIIVGLFLFSVGYTFYSLFRLQREFHALNLVQERVKKDPRQKWVDGPALKLIPYSLARERLGIYAEQTRQGVPPDSASHEGRVDSLFYMRSTILRYFSGLLVFLGLLGTFVGLLIAIGAVTDLMGSITTAPTGEGGMAFMEELKSKLGRPLGGMATAFSTSVFGLVTSLIVGFLHLQLTSAQNRFVARLEAFDSAYLRPGFMVRVGGAQFGGPGSGGVSDRAAGHLAMAQNALGENLNRLMTIVERTEAMQANFREVMITMSKEIEVVNSAMSRLASNQDLMREASTNLVELNYGQSDSQRTMVNELQGLQESLGRLNGLLVEQQEKNRDFQADLIRSLDRYFDLDYQRDADGASNADTLPTE